MIHLQCQGFLFNNVTQYAVARILAEEMGYRLKISHSHNKPKVNTPQFIQLMASFKDAPLDIPGQEFHQPVDRSAQMGHGDFDGYRLDIARIVGDKSPRKIELQGYFERYGVFKSYKQRIRQWFAIDPFNSGQNIHADDVVVHIRGGDFVLNGRAITLKFYTRLLDTMDFRRLYICGFGLDDEVRKTFAPYSPHYVNGSPVEDFRFIKGFNRIIQSHSTFAWWAGFLSEADEIYAPIPVVKSTGSKLNYRHIDLRVDDESRYHYIEDVASLNRSIMLADVARAAKQIGQRRKPALYMEALSNEVSARREALRKSLLLTHLRQTRHRLTRYGRSGYRFDSNSTSIPGGYRKILIIRINHAYAGFFSYFTFVLNQILFCERNNCLPVVFFGKQSVDGPNAYFDAERGDNMWEYFFEPVAGVTHEDVMSWVNDPAHPVNDSDIVSLDVKDLWYLHLYEPRSVYGYPYGRYRNVRRYDRAWYQRNRIEANRVISQYVRVKPPIAAKIENFVDLHMKAAPVLGLHLRGSDKGTAVTSTEIGRIVGPREYIPHIEKFIAANPQGRLFVASDQQQFIDLLVRKYGERVLSTDSYRNESNARPFETTQVSGYTKGEEVLVDAMLLSRCDFLLRCASHVSEAALWFNPTLPNLDLNYPVQGF